MRFKIVGANAESGDDVDVMLEAPTQPDVEKLAHDKGILVASITEIATSTATSTKGDLEAIALVDEPPATSNGSPASHGVITMSANAPSGAATTSTDGHAPAPKHADAAMEYHIMMNQSLYLLESAVNKQLRDGWEPQGGVAIGVANNAMNYFQALVRHHKQA